MDPNIVCLKSLQEEKRHVRKRPYEDIDRDLGHVATSNNKIKQASK